MERNSFVYYRSFYEATKELPKDIVYEIDQAIKEYALNGVEPTELRPIAKGFFNAFRPQIDANNKRFENGCKGGKYGHLGGRPKNPKETPNEPQDVVLETPKKPQENPKETPNVNDNDNDNDIKENISNDISKKEELSLFSASDESEAHSINYLAVMKLWNTTVGGNGRIPTIVSLNDTRKRKIKLRAGELGAGYLEKFKEIFERMAKSSFLRGEVGPFCASFDWLFTNDSNMQKLMEGNYDDKPRTATTGEKASLTNKRYKSWNE